MADSGLGVASSNMPPGRRAVCAAETQSRTIGAGRCSITLEEKTASKRPACVGSHGAASPQVTSKPLALAGLHHAGSTSTPTASWPAAGQLAQEFAVAAAQIGVTADAAARSK